MTIQDELENDAETLEDSFFGSDAAPLLAELKRGSDAEQRLRRLRDVVRLKDEDFVRRLAALGIRPETAVAVALVPMIVVAWSDGKLDGRERAAILEAARDTGVAAEGIARRLLRNALERPPDPRLLGAWKGYVRRLWGCFTADERWEMRTQLLQSARTVAEASGGFLGLTSGVSGEQRRILAEIEAVLD